MPEVRCTSDQSETTFLRQCLVEGDAAARHRAHRLRRRALAISLAVQTAVLAALVLVPLFATGQLPKLLLRTPVPPYAKFIGPAQSAYGGSPPKTGPKKPNVDPTKLTFQPPRIPQDIATSDDRAPDVTSKEPFGSGNRPDAAMGGIERQRADDSHRVPPIPAQPPAPAPKARVKTSEGVQQALLVRRVQPVYPPLAVQIRLEGTVRVHAVIGRDGTVRELEALSGHPILAKAAMEAVQQWRYQPTLLNGEPVEVETYITVVFQLQH